MYDIIPKPIKAPFILSRMKGRVNMRFFGRRPLMKKMREYFSKNSRKQILKHWKEVLD